MGYRNVRGQRAWASRRTTGVRVEQTGASSGHAFSKRPPDAFRPTDLDPRLRHFDSADRTTDDNHFPQDVVLMVCPITTSVM
jgi:hypothetical protein